MRIELGGVRGREGRTAPRLASLTTIKLFRDKTVLSSPAEPAKHKELQTVDETVSRISTTSR